MERGQKRQGEGREEKQKERGGNGGKRRGKMAKGEDTINATDVEGVRWV
jgi:hypothetical protein